MVFSQSLQGDVKEWFKHLQPESISTWEEFSEIFLKFWGKRRSLDQILSKFYSMKKQEGETIVDNTSIPHSSVSSNIPNRYKPLHLPLILHDFPTKNYKYLPKFDG